MDFSFLHLLKGVLSTALAIFSKGEVAANGKLDRILDEVVFGF